MTKSYIVDPNTGKLLTAQEWKEIAGESVSSVKMVAIVPDDGSHAFAFPVETFGGRHNWHEAMAIAEKYKAPHPVFGSSGVFTLPTRKQAIDIRAARESGLEQLLELIGANDLLSELQTKCGWTCERYVPAGTSEDRWSSVLYSGSLAWSYNYYGMSNGVGLTYSGSWLVVRPVTLLKLV